MRKSRTQANRKRPARSGKTSAVESFTRILLNANPLPAFLTDLTSLRFIEVNEAAVKKYGYSRAEFLRMRLDDIRPPEDVPRLLETAKKLREGELEHKGLWRHKLKNGQIIDVEIFAHAIDWEGRLASLAIAHDISERKRMESALKGAQEELGEIVTHAPVILWMTDRDGSVLLSEGKGLIGLGFRPGELVGRSAFDLYPGIPRASANLRRALAGESFTDVLDVNGVTLETHFVPRRDEGGAVIGILGVSTDVSERRRADVLLHQQAAAIRASMDGMAIHDEEGRFVYLNDAHARLYGYDRPEDLIGKSWRSLYSPEQLRRFETEIMPRFWKEGQWRGEAVGRRQDGSAFPQEISLTRIEGGGLVCVVRDISERRRAESEHNRLLHLEKDARAEAEAASRAKDEFLAVVSHELRTPMTAILGWTWLLRSGDVPQSERNRALEIIERNMKLQAQIIEDLLDLSSIVTGKLHLDVRPVELAAILQAAADTIRTTAEAKAVRIEIECDAAVSVYGDHYRLQQVFWNLISNAVKFNRDAGAVRVRARVSEGCAMVAVEDDGAGIEKEFVHEMFDLFRQGESSLTRQHRGLGIGLAIVRHLVELHGGQVSAESPGVGRGATFTVTLPLSKHAEPSRAGAPPAAGAARPSRLAHTLDGLKVLVVDDELDTLQMLAELLRYCGARVATAPSASDALGAFQKERPELLVSDIAMPNEDGYSLMRKVRALGPAGGGSVLALALTARAKEEDRDAALEAGYQMYLAKPVEPEDLVTAIRNLVKHSR
ncbi:MAG: PAS domain S-box protein [Elusimicrobia bacterium]|nr:PAS domain S-box protein [Elusimicrobiota bacterium]